MEANQALHNEEDPPLIRRHIVFRREFIELAQDDQPQAIQDDPRVLDLFMQHHLNPMNNNLHVRLMVTDVDEDSAFFSTVRQEIIRYF